MPVLTTCKDGEEAVEAWRALSFIREMIGSALICGGVEKNMREGREADLVELANFINASSTSKSTKQHSIVDRGKRTHGD